jgi:Spy/CpxP family protein refolding chaperone
MQAMRMAAVVAALVVAVPLAAQQGPPGGRPGGMGGGMGGDPAAMQARQNERLFQGITLSAEQRAKVDSIQAVSRARQQELMEAGGMRNAETRQQMMQQRQATMAAIRGVLTAEQQAKFDENLANMPAAAAGGRPPQGTRPPRR